MHQTTRKETSDISDKIPVTGTHVTVDRVPDEFFAFFRDEGKVKDALDRLADRYYFHTSGGLRAALGTKLADEIIIKK